MNPKTWKYDTNMLLVALERLDEKIPAPHYDAEKLEKELNDLRAEQVGTKCSVLQCVAAQ